MEYALVKNGVVENIIVLLSRNAQDFPNAVSIEDLPVQIGDTYDGERFYHDGEPIYSLEEQLSQAQQITDIMTGEVE